MVIPLNKHYMLYDILPYRLTPGFEHGGAYDTSVLKSVYHWILLQDQLRIGYTC